MDQLKALGADVVVTEEFAHSAEMAKVLGDLPKPVLALNGVGGQSATDLTRLLGNNGTLVTYGGMSKHGVTALTSSLIFKNITLRGFWLTQWTATHSPQERQQVLSELAVCDIAHE